jgi:hypothetical protein
MIVDHAHQLVDQESLRLGRVMARAGSFDQPARNFRPPRLQGGAQGFDHLLAGARRRVFGHQRGDRGGQRAPVDHGALVGDAQGVHARLLSCCGA